MLITIAFEGESDRDIVLRVEPKTTLQQVREQLAAKAGMQPAERFRIGNANLDPDIEADTAVEDVVGEDKTLKVKPAPKAAEPAAGKPAETPTETPAETPTETPVEAPAEKPGEKPGPSAPAKPTGETPPAKPEPRPVPKPTPTQAKPTEAAWGLSSDGETPDLLKQLQSQLAAFTVRDPDEFTALPLTAVRALFTARRLNRGLRFGPDPGDPAFGGRAPQAPVEYLHPDRPPHSGSVPFTMRWTTSATASRVLHELHTRSIHNANASGGLNGFGLAATFRHDLERLQRSEVTSIHLVDEMIVPKVMLQLDPETDLKATPALIAAVERALSAGGGRRGQYEALHERVFASFGYFFPCEALLGGTRMRTLSVQSEDLQDQEQLLSGFSFGAAAQDVPTSYGPASGEIGYGNSESSLSKNRHIQQLRQQDVRTVGGHAALGLTDEQLGQWVASLDAVGQWEVIGNRALVPILRFLPAAPRQRCVSLIEEFANSSATARYTVLNMAEYVVPLNRELLDQIM